MKTTKMSTILVLVAAAAVLLGSAQEASGGTLAAWGQNYQGQCDVPPGNDFVAVAAGRAQSLALKSDGSLAAWGQNSYGECNVPAGNDFAAIAAGGYHGLALKYDGSLAAWGENNYGQCDVPAGNNFAAIAGGGFYSLALKSDGSLAAWGENNYGQCDVPAGSDFAAIAAGGRYGLALKSDGSLAAWGRNDYGGCNVPAGNDFAAIAAGSHHSLALKSDGTLAAWGWNNYGQCNVPEGNDFADVAAGLHYSLALKSDGSLAAWGRNDIGQCDVPAGNDFVAIAGGSIHSLAIAAAPMAMGTAFAYQGRLLDGGRPADGLYDFQFKIYNNPYTTIQEGNTIDINDLDVIDGHFVVELDFGSEVFKGMARWLQVGVRPGDSNGVYTTLSPRTELTPTPYALYANYAKTAGSDNDWMVVGSDMYSIPEGNIGVGTTSPTYKLDVAGSLRADGLRTKPNATSTNLIGGHSGNIVTSGVVAATIGGGGDSTRTNIVTDSYGTVSGGGDNQAGDYGGTATDATYATVGGGLGNKASVEFATVGGGADNTAGLRDSDPTLGNTWPFEPSYATVGGGQGNIARGAWSTVGGGNNNTASEQVPYGEDDWYSFGDTVAGGAGNTATGSWSTVGGGQHNTAGGFGGWGFGSTVSGGESNKALGDCSTVPGGYLNEAKGDVSFAAGYRAKVKYNHDGTFVWADSTNEDFASTSINQFLIRASGGVGIGTNYPNEKLTVEGALSLDEISAPSASAGYGKVYVKSTDGELYFKNDAGFEYKLSAGGEDFIVGNFLICANDTERGHGATGPVLLKETKIGRGGTLRIKFDLRATHPSYSVFAYIWRNGTPVGTMRNTNSTGYVTFSEDISGWSKGDLVQVLGYTTHPSYPVIVRNFRLYVNNPAEAGARY